MLLGHKCPGVLYGITSIFPTDDISSRRNLACRPTVYILILYIYIANYIFNTVQYHEGSQGGGGGRIPYLAPDFT